MKILVIIGTRPEAIKMAPVISELAARPGFLCRICTTGQHLEMLQQILQVFNLTPNYALGVMRADQALSELAARVLLGLDPVLLEMAPDLMLVQGDTTTVMVAALAAHHRRIPVGHIEAGLRTWDRGNPFPEEINRQMVARLSSLHFAPTGQAAENLCQEGIAAGSIHVTGNTVVDALQMVLDKPAPADFDRLVDPGKRLVLVTAHRRENFGRPLENICGAVAELARKYDDLQFIFPVHLNPQVQAVAYRMLADLPGVKLIAPVDYVTLVHLMRESTLILTDSGGIQEEAPSFGVPVLVLRESTERPEGVLAGIARLVGTQRLQIVEQVECLLRDTKTLQYIRTIPNPYGDGRAARRIVDILAGLDTRS